MRRRVFKILALIAVALLGWLTTLGVIIWSFGSEEQARPSDCIIVLGAAVQGAEPSPVFEERIKHAVSLHQQGEAPRIIFTGGFGDGATHAESEVGAAYALRAGISKDSILTENRSRTTHQNLVEAKALMDVVGFQSAIIVSDPLHLKRASVMAEDLEISAVTSPTPTSRYRSLKTKLGFLARELCFYHYYVFLGG